MIFLNETKLDHNVKSSEFTPIGYKCFRKDRTRDGEGVTVVVKECLTACEIPMDEVTGEVCCVKIDTNDNPLHVGSFHCTTSDRNLHKLLELEKSLNHIQTLTRNNPNAFIVVSIYFNAGDIDSDWENCTIPIGKTPVRIILWCPITKMLIKACFLIQPLV